MTEYVDLLPSFLSAGGYDPAIAALEAYDFPYAELVTHRFALEQVEAAYDVVRNKRDDVIKAVLVLED
ncbi:MAG: hypothetical protein Q7T71_20100 [Herbiconiux sp.]|nr:hypothetical protein [Herbiconiux sp.]